MRFFFYYQFNYILFVCCLIIEFIRARTLQFIIVFQTTTSVQIVLIILYPLYIYAFRPMVQLCQILESDVIITIASLKYNMISMIIHEHDQ